MDETGSAAADSQTRPIVLLDTNTIQHALSKASQPQISPFLDELTSEGNAVLSISDIVVFESLKSIAFSPAKYAPVVNFIDGNLTRYPISHDVLVGAAQLHEMYGKHDAVKGHANAISTEALIIAVTSILTGGFVLTSDCNDFPGPFFDVVHKQVFYFNDGSRRKHIVKYLLRPDLDLIREAFNDHDGAPAKKT
jgi:predicted nucleic acid-binding protein